MDELVPLLTEEWAHLYSDWTADLVRRELADSLKAEGLPETLVALEDSILLGTVSIIHDDLPGREEFNPWLASLFVLPRHRGRGVAALLVRAAEDWSRRQSFSDLYLFTESAGPLFEKLGWQPLDSASCNGHPVTIYSRSLQG